MPKRRPSLPARAAKRRRGEDEDEEDVEPEESDGEEEPEVEGHSALGPLPSQAEAEVGVVERILLKNFMCHGLLDIKLGPHVNFIIGRNGSGKSAVVTGLVVGLGGAASVTSRGSRIRSFVKTGKQMAEVQIHLRNRGPDAYKHDLYGDTIVIQRKISSDGGTRYLMRNIKGKQISNKAEDLTKIRDFFNIQVENPVAILNQDTSRNFLHSKNPHDKYKFFLKATQLEQMKTEYDKANESKAATKHGLNQYEMTLVKLKEEVSRWEEKYNNLGNITELKHKVKALKHEMAWAIVVEKEKSMEPHFKALRTQEARLPKFEQKLAESKAKVEASQEQLKTVQAQLLAVTEEAEHLKPQLQEKREASNVAKAAYRAAQNESKTIARDLENARSEQRQIMERIKELKQTAQSSYEEERLGRQRKLEQLEEQLRATETRLRTSQHEREQFASAAGKYKTDGYQIQRDEQAKQQEMRQCEENIQTLSQARSNRFRRFGAWVPAALTEIDKLCRQGKFHQRPRGPLGACFQLKDQRWALAMEVCLRGLIHCYVCHDHHDEKQLEAVFQQHGPRRRPAIITCAFRDEVHDYSQLCVRGSPYPMVLDMIECDDPVVMNALIDQRSVENIILIADAAEARQVMLHRPPTNCKEAFTTDGDQMYCSPTFRNYSSDMTAARFLTSDVEGQIENLQAQKARLQAELGELSQQRQGLHRQVSTNQREEKKCETQIMKLSEQLNTVHNEIKELRSIEDPAPVDISTLEEDVQEYARQIATLEERSEKSSNAAEERKEEAAAAEREYRDVETEMKNRANSDIPLKDELNNAQTALDEAQQHKKHYQASLKEHQACIARQKKEIDAKKKEIEADTDKARQICAERIDTRRMPTNIEREINQINIRIKEEEKTQGDPLEITRHYHDTKSRYQEIESEIRGFSKFIRKLDSVMDRRNKAFQDFQRTIALRTKYFFIVMLSHRNYLGRMVFNHSSQCLEMWVSPTEESSGTKDLKSLSGGERSFSTVCFILSLWNAMESPFRCLDEFDVFMDLVNRRISMELMLEMTKTQVNKQFIFLTPQDMSQLSLSKLTGRPRIFQMPDPDRSASQATLPFGQRASQDDEDQE